MFLSLFRKKSGDNHVKIQQPSPVDNNELRDTVYGKIKILF